MQQVPTVQSWMSGGSTLNHTDSSIADHILNKYILKLKKAIKANFEEPKAHLQSFGMDSCFHVLLHCVLYRSKLFKAFAHSHCLIQN